MKYKIVLLIILLPVFVAAQTQNSDKDSLAGNVLKSLEDSWTLGIDSNSEAVDIRMYNKFKSLFELNATIDDDINVEYRYGYDDKSKKYSSHYTVNSIPKPFDEYAHDVALKVSKLVIEPIDTLLRSFGNSDNMIVEISRRVSAGKKGRYILPDTASFADKVINSRSIGYDDKTDKAKLRNEFENVIYKYQDSVYAFAFTDTLRITMFYKNDSVRIKSIEIIGEKKRYYTCSNDQDNDALLKQDKDDSTAGDFTADGLPDYDLDGVPDVGTRDSIDKCRGIYGSPKNHGCPESYFISNNKFDGFVGFQLNAAPINLPELNKLGYRDAAGNDAMDVLQSKKGVLKNPGLMGGLYAGVNYAHYFGQKKKQNGISAGVTYSAFKAGYELTEPVIYTFKSNDGSDDYRRQIQINSLNEDISYHIFNFPVMYNFRWFFGKTGKNNTRSSFNFKVGPSLMLFSTTSDYKARISFGGLYQVENGKIVYTDPYDNGSTYNVIITADGINSQDSIPGANEIFRQLKDYDFASDKQYEGSQKNSIRLTAALNLGFNWQQQITGALAFEIGAHLAYAPLPERNEKYKPIDKTTDEFQSIYNSSAKSSYSAYGISLGFVYDF